MCRAYFVQPFEVPYFIQTSVQRLSIGTIKDMLPCYRNALMLYYAVCAHKETRILYVCKCDVISRAEAVYI